MNSDSLIRAKPLNGRTSLSRRSIYGLIVLLSVVCGILFQSAFKDSRELAKPQNLSLPRPSDSIARLPSDYSEIRREPKPTPIVVVKRVGQPPVSELEKERQKALAEQLKRASEARVAPIGFAGISAEALRGSSHKGRSEAEDQSSSSNLRQRSDEKDLARTILAGTIIPGILLTGINSDLPGPILGQVSQNVFDTVSGRNLLIPQGTKMIGEYDSKVVYGQERVLVVWTRLNLTDGRTIDLQRMPGADMSGYSGLRDRVNHHFGRLLTGVVLSSILGAGAQMAEGPVYRTQDPAYGQLAVQGVASEASQVGQEITRRNLEIPPTIEIRPGKRLNLHLNVDLLIVPEEY